MCEAGEEKSILIDGQCRTCGSERKAAGFDYSSVERALKRLDAYVCETGDHYFPPGKTLWEMYKWNFPIENIDQIENQNSES